MASGKGTKTYKKLQSGAGEGQGAADTVTPSQVPLEGTQPHQGGGLGVVPPGLWLHIGQVKAPHLLAFAQTPPNLLELHSQETSQALRSPRQEAGLWAGGAKA